MNWIVFLYTIWQTFQFTRSKGSIFLEFVEFNNPTGEGANGHCCDGRWRACQRNGCDHYFQICLTDIGGIRGDATGCLTTDAVKNQNRIVFEDSVGDVDNPVEILKYDLMKDYELRISIYDKDRFNSDDYVDTLWTHLHFNYSSVVSQPITLTSRTRLELIVWYSCSDDYYDCEEGTGEELCSEYCVEPTNGYCDFYGNVVCFQGYTGRDCSVTEEWATSSPRDRQREWFT